MAFPADRQCYPFVIHSWTGPLAWKITSSLALEITRQLRLGMKVLDPKLAVVSFSAGMQLILAGRKITLPGRMDLLVGCCAVRTVR